MSVSDGRPPPASKRYASRTGACKVGACACDTYVREGNLDGFETCTCAHTQVSHTEEGTINP